MSEIELEPLDRSSADPSAQNGHASPNGHGKSDKMKRVATFQERLKRKDDDTVHLSWKNLTYKLDIVPPTAKKKKQKKIQKVILNNITAHASAGEFLAVMGPSGAGKTSLLNLVSGRESVNKAQLEGDILLNGTPLDRKSLKGISGYVLQDDALLPHLTVREAITFSAMLRLPSSMTMPEKLERVEAVITELNLVACANTKIGNAMVKGVSGGERKRCAIGVELITDPTVLFLDEPTTGLDSFTAMGIVETLKSLARNNRTIICTIHQPRSNIFELFDNLLLLARGEVSFFGPASQAVAYFANQGYHCPTFSNPADYFLDITADDSRSAEAVEDSDKRVKELIEGYKGSKFAQQASLNVNKSGAIRQGFRGAGFWNQFAILSRRAIRNATRDRMTYGVRLVQNILLGILMGLIYLNLGHDQTTIQDRLGLLFFVMINQSFGALFTPITVFPAERKVVQRERRAGFYRVLPYYLSKTVSELPLQIFFPIVIGVLVYWMSDLQRTAAKFFIFLGVLELTTYCAESLGLFLAILITNQGIALAIAPLTLVMFLIFSGFYINYDSIPPYFIWMAYISFIRWGFEAIVVNEFEGLSLYCKPDQLSDGGECPVTDGSQVIKSLGFEDPSIWKSVVVLVGMTIVYRVAAYVALRLRKKIA